MNNISYFDSKDFNLDEIASKKNDKKVFVVFSTFGEREANLIYDKISLLKKGAGKIIDKIILSHRRNEDKVELTEIKAMEADRDTEIVICNSYKVPDMGDERGKGSDMRRTLYYINKNYSSSNIIIVFLDADVLTEYFNIHFLLGLAGAIINGHDFAKASFWRKMGRVKKFVAQPLFSVIDHPVIQKLTDFSYPLSGEVAGTLEFFNSVNFWQIYGVETGINIDSCFNNFKIADVNLGLYDHEHHPDQNIQKMSFGIIRTFLTQLIDYGLIELKNNAQISDVFKYSFIDSDEKRQFQEFNLKELKYKPLKKIIA